MIIVVNIGFVIGFRNLFKIFKVMVEMSVFYKLVMLLNIIIKKELII